MSARLKIEINPSLTEKSFDVAGEGYARLAAAPTTPEEQIEQLADGVFVIRNVAGPNQNTLAVAFKDYIVAVEAPGSSDGADQVIARIKASIPGKPIRYVAMTHHHSDHIGGLRSFIAEGATVLTTPGNREVVEMMAAAPQNDRLAKNPRKPEIVLIQRGKHVLSDGTQRLELIDVGPNPHAREMVVAYLPKQRVVFQGDLFFTANDDLPSGPPQPTTVSFVKKMQELRLDVGRVAGVHGRTVTKEEFERSLLGEAPPQQQRSSRVVTF